MNDMNDWFFGEFHDDAPNELGLTRWPEIAALVMFIIAGVLCAIVMGLNYGGIL
jgi:hypothetical protein